MLISPFMLFDSNYSLLFIGRNICLIILWDGRSKEEQIWIYLPFLALLWLYLCHRNPYVPYQRTAFGDLACPTGPADWLHVVLVKNLRAHAGKFRHDSFPARWECGSHYLWAHTKTFRKEHFSVMLLSAYLCRWISLGLSLCRTFPMWSEGMHLPASLCLP